MTLNFRDPLYRRHRFPAEVIAHAEFIYVLSGRLIVNVDGKEAALDGGDAVYFDSSVPHSYRREGKEISTAIVVTSS